jgi:peptidoglycan hydrolase-like protein with peptidoglycan-binding domain
MCQYGAGVVPTPSSTQATAPGTTLSCSIVPNIIHSIRFGGTNTPSDVKVLQQYLNTYEGTSFTVDGIYTKPVRDAVIHWQEKYAAQVLTPWGLKKGTGYVYLTSLKQIRKIHAASCTAAAHTEQVAGLVCPAIPVALKPGSKGPETLEAQEQLQSLGYLTATPNSYYGVGTTAAVKSFQSANGISATGKLDISTATLLGSKACAGK